MCCGAKRIQRANGKPRRSIDQNDIKVSAKARFSQFPGKRKSCIQSRPTENKISKQAILDVSEFESGSDDCQILPWRITLRNHASVKEYLLRGGQKHINGAVDVHRGERLIEC